MTRRKLVVLCMTLALCLTMAPVQASAKAAASGGAAKTAAASGGGKTDPFLQKGKETSRYQYHLDATKARKAWSLLEKQKKHGRVLVADLDTGVDAAHEDLQKNLQKTEKGYIRFVDGKKKQARDDTDELTGHGTHVAGIIGATYHNGKGGSGVAAGHNNDLVKVLPVGISTDGESLNCVDIVAGIRYAVSRGAKVINMSFGTAERDRNMEAAIKEAFYKHGVVFVAASGNSGTDGPDWPSGMREVIAVNASDNAGGASIYWSDYGVMKDITAPGTNILSTLPGDRYDTMSGTSMAAPVLSGIAALVRDANPKLTPDQVKNILCATTDQKGVFRERTTAYGNVDAEAAVRAALKAKASIPVKSVTMKRKSMTMTEGDDGGLDALVLPATSLQPRTWESSDESIVKVDQYGNLQAIGTGEATVTVRAGEKSDTCTVTVEPSVRAAKLRIYGAPKDGEMEEGEELYLSGEINPPETTNTEIYWSSSNPKAAMVYEEGFVRAIKAGKTTITARTVDGKVRATVKLTVKPYADKLKFTRTIPWLFQGEKGVFAGKLLDKKGRANVAHKEITWSSSNRRIATVDRKTGRVTALKPGKFYVKASNFDGWVTASRQVIVAKRKYAGRKDYNLRQTKTAKKQVTVAWKKIPVAAGYQLQEKVKTGKSAWKWKNLKTLNGSRTSFVVKGKKKRTFRVRAYYKRKNTVRYFGWSNVIRTKPGTGRK